MRFLDFITISFHAGNGGPGTSSFSRALFKPRPLPDGGNGGCGGNVFIIADSNLTSLASLAGKIRLSAADGARGDRSFRTGKNGKDLVVMVPPGTQILTPDKSQLIADLSKSGDRFCIAKGGKGGNGNGTDPSFEPRSGNLGRIQKARLELKTIADVGLVGFPNAGKSSLLRALTNAHPEVGSYEFTTLVPHLGTLSFSDKKKNTIRIADLPGLIEGAAENRGLGNRFLRHVERCSVLVHMIDISQPWEVFQERLETLNSELKKYNPDFDSVKQILVGSKMDLDAAKANAIRLKKESKIPWIFVSSKEFVGLEELKNRFQDTVKKQNSLISKSTPPLLFFSSPAPEIQLQRLKMGIWSFSGPLTRRLCRALPESKAERIAFEKLNQILEKPEVRSYFSEAGVKAGDTIFIETRSFVWK